MRGEGARDLHDFESVIYTALDLANHRLPWFGIDSEGNGCNVSISTFCPLLTCVLQERSWN